MRRSIALLVLLAAGSSYASDKTYQAGRLNGIAIQDVTKTYAAPERGRDYFQTWHFGVDYQFQIVADDIVYIADCWSRATRNYASDWLLKDPIEFRIEKNQLFLKRPEKGELRLALMNRLPLGSAKNDAEVAQQAHKALSPATTHQIVPECR